jgi:hypothetical protein
MNQIIAGIYGTGGQEKVASADGERITSLSDLALLMVSESNLGGDDLEKVASAHSSALDDLINFDRSGRAMAHYEFSEMEKAAASGDMSALEAFFADLAGSEKTASLRAAVEQEIERRIRLG